MTGFAQTSAHEEGFVLTVTLRSVNHKSLDLHLHLPESLQAYEAAVRKEVAALRARGNLHFKVTIERDSLTGPRVNEALIEAYVEHFRVIAQRLGLSLETALSTLAHLPGVISAGSVDTVSQLSPNVEAALLGAVRETLCKWDDMRATEGAALEEELRARGSLIANQLERLESIRLQLLPIAQKKIRDRLQSWLDQQVQIDPSRLAQEAAMLGEKTDVTEELARLKAHFAQFAMMFEEGPEVGKKCDFLMQEILRELNTTLAKTAGLGESGLPMTQAALEMKAEAEKIREQVQNIQ